MFRRLSEVIVTLWFGVLSELCRRLGWLLPTGGRFPTCVGYKAIDIFTLDHNIFQLVSCLTFVTAGSILFFFLICLQVSSFIFIFTGPKFLNNDDEHSSSSFASSNRLYLSPCSSGYEPILKALQSIWSSFVLYIRSIPSWSYRKVTATCHYRYPFFTFITSWLLYRISRSSSKAFGVGTYCILETLRWTTSVQNSLYPYRSIHHLRSHLSSCCGTSGDASPLPGVECAER